MTNLDGNTHTAKLIIKSVLKTLSKEEKDEFDNWLIDRNNYELYYEILKSKNIDKKFQTYDSLDTGSAYSKLLKRLEAKQIKVHSKVSFDFRDLYKYAAMFLLMLSISYSVFYFVSQESKTQEPKDIMFSVVDDIKPGNNKATLVLEDGSRIELQETNFIKKQALVDIKNEANTLTYKSKDTKDFSNVNQKIGTNTLYVPVGGLYKLILPDGSRVWLNSSSSLKYPVSFASDQRIVELKGEAYFEVEKDKKAFIVKTKTRDISVLGTSFNVTAYNDDSYFAATLTEGKIKLTHENQKEVFLAPGQQAIVNNSAFNSVVINSVNPDVYSAWRNGTFFFENERLDVILHKVGRWYNFKTEFTESELKNITFTGLVSKDFPAKRLLKMISMSTNIKYEIIQNKASEEYLVKISRR